MADITLKILVTATHFFRAFIILTNCLLGYLNKTKSLELFYIIKN